MFSGGKTAGSTAEAKNNQRSLSLSPALFLHKRTRRSHVLVLRRTSPDAAHRPCHVTVSTRHSVVHKRRITLVSVFCVYYGSPRLYCRRDLRSTISIVGADKQRVQTGSSRWPPLPRAQKNKTSSACRRSLASMSTIPVSSLSCRRGRSRRQIYSGFEVVRE